MKITDVNINGFGVWTDLAVSDLNGKMTVFYGPNEAGKTTLMQFMRAVLYGLTPERRSKYMPPVHGGKPGGSLCLSGPYGTFQCLREVGASADPASPGNLSITRADGSVVGGHQITTLLSDIDEPIFNNVFAFGLRELQELGTLSNTAASELLYKLTSGLDRVSIVDVMRSLQEARLQLVSLDGETCELADLLERRQGITQEIESLTEQGRHWSGLATERMSVTGEVANLDKLISELDYESRKLAMAIQVHDNWMSRDATDEQIESLEPVTSVPESAIADIDKLNRMISEKQGLAEQLRHQCTRLRDEYRTLPIDRKLWSYSSRIEAMDEQLPWLESLENQINWIHQDVSKSQKDLRVRGTELELDVDAIYDRLPEITTSAKAMLEGPATELHESETFLRETRHEADQAKEEAKELSKHMDGVLADNGQMDLAGALERAGEQVTQLRRRIQIEHRIDKMGRAQVELNEDLQELKEEQILSWQNTLGIGMAFAIGVACILSGWNYLWGTEQGVLLIFFGLALSVFAGVVKFMLERNAETELEDTEQQIEQVQQQQSEARQEREQLDEELPPGQGSLDVRLKTAEEHVEKLEELLPLNTEVEAANQRSSAANRRVHEAENELRQATDRWKRALREAGLPDKMNPEQIRQIADGVGQMSTTVTQLSARQQELANRQEELDALRNRIETIMQDVGVRTVSDDPRAQIGQLKDLLARQQHMIERRRELKKEFREARRDLMKVRRTLDKLDGRRSAMFATAGAEDETEYRELAVRYARYVTLCEERDDLDTQIEAALGDQFHEDIIAHELHTVSDESLEQRLERIQTRMQDAQARQAHLHQRLGELNSEIKSLAKDRSLAAARLELNCLNQRIQTLAKQWRTYAVMGKTLEEVCQRYESERQPETLNAASSYLEQMTEGKYQRIWTPMHENNLYVDTAEGESLRLEVLSRGTVEAVFICLRLALVAAYARRGIVLPLVLDDVLVNFDLQRAQAASEVFRDFAEEGHQMLMFTCHHHMMQMFHELGVDIRVLPSRSGEDHTLVLEEPAATSPPTVVPTLADIEPEDAEPSADEDLQHSCLEDEEDEQEVSEDEYEAEAHEEEEQEEPEDAVDEVPAVALDAEAQDESDPPAEPTDGNPFELWWDQPLRYERDNTRVLYDDGELVEYDR